MPFHRPGRVFRRAPRRRTLGTALLLAFLVVSGAGGAVAHSSGSPPKLRWLEITSPTMPAARDWAAMAYDAADHDVVLYGGYNPTAGGLYSDTWTFQGGVWTERYPTAHPPATSGLVLAYDPTLKGVVAFGGQAAYGSAFYNDTWLYKGGNWTNLTPPGPSPPSRSQYSMAYDAAAGELMLFGGESPRSTDLSDTWTFNGTAWKQIHPTVSPPGRQFAGMVYDPVAGAVLLVGGLNATVGDEPGTWVYRAGNWTNLSRPGPLPALDFPYVSSTQNGTPLLFGGHDQATGISFNSTYEFLGTHWRSVRSVHAPGPRNNGGFAYDARDHWVVLFGGRSATGWLGDTWIIL